MLSCDDVRAALPGVEAGERASGAVRDHLASCEACRAEGARLRADLVVLRRDLAALAPSPFLEDAVVETAHTTEPGSLQVPRGGLWLRAGIALAAASLLVAVLLVTRNGENGRAAGPGEDGDDARGPLVWFPPSAGEVVAARKANPPRFEHGVRADGRVLYRHWYRNEDRGLTTFSKETLDPPVPGLAHRWVVAPGEVGDRTFGMVGVPPRGVQVVGKALLARAGGEKAIAGFKEYVDTGAPAVIEIEVGAPGAGAATARVDVVLRPDYSGSLLLEEPLARALGLYQFEIPGACRVEGDSTTAAHRARARVVIRRWGTGPKDDKPRRLPDFDEVVEVQVRAAGDPPAAELLPPAQGTEPVLRIEGERPPGFMTARSIELVPGPQVFPHVVVQEDVKNVRFPETSERFGEGPIGRVGPRLVFLGYFGGAHPPCAAVLSRIDVPEGSSRGYRLRMERVRLSGTYEPGAQVVVSRVWRGKTAIPSRESVAFTTVGADGRVSFVRQPGETGGRLRMLLRPKEGGPRWVDVDVNRRRLIINVMKDGSVYLKGYQYSLWKEPSAPGEPLRGDPEALEALRSQLTELVNHDRRPDEHGAGDLVVVLYAQADTPWRLLQWIMQTCAHPDVRLSRLAFEVMEHADGPLRNDLPADRGLMSGPPRDYRKIRVVLRREGEVTRFATRGGPAVVEGAVGGPGSALAALQVAVQRELASADGETRVELVTPPPTGGRVPYVDIVSVLDVLKRAGAGQILFEGAATPR